MASKNVWCTNFILWASVFPDDLDFNIVSKETNTTLIYGNQDEFLTEERVALLRKQIEDSKIDVNVITFDGKHDIPKEVLVEESKKNNWN